MPFRRKIRRKRRFRRRASAMKPKSLIRLRPGVPHFQVVKLRYVEKNSISPGVAGIPNTKIFSLNGLYDPDISGAGNQPRFFDTYCGSDEGVGMYKHYTVLGARATCDFYSQDATYDNRVYVSVQDSTNVSTSWYYYEESADIKKTTIGKTGSSDAYKRLSLNWSARRWFAKPNVTTERDLTGNDTSNPLEQAYMHVTTANPQGVDTGSIYVITTIDYIVKFHSPVQVLQS